MNMWTTTSRSVVSMAAVFGMALVGMGYGASANAGCGLFEQKKVDSQGTSARFMPATILRVSTEAESQGGGYFGDNSIVGFWKIQFLSKGNTGIPDGTQLDFGYVQWHADGTEIMNSGAHAPITSNFCMGVWEKTGPSSYKLNHVALAWDSTGTVFIGPAQIREQVTVENGGNHYSGTIAITQFATDEKTVLGHVTGVVTADRVTADGPI